jgi:hypothetical protein
MGMMSIQSRLLARSCTRSFLLVASCALAEGACGADGAAGPVTSDDGGAAADATTVGALDGGGTALPDSGPPLPVCDPGAGDVTFAVDATQAHPISRFVYGTNVDDYIWPPLKNVWTTTAKNLTVGRAGGNSWTAYNWENNATNAGSDYQYANYAYLGGGETSGEAMRMRVDAARKAGASELVTIPIQGWVAADKSGAVDPGATDLTQRFRATKANKGSARAYPPITTDAVVYEDELVAWIESQFPAARTDPERTIFYSLDNEPDAWASTHKEVQKTPLTYAELTKKNAEMATMIKRVAPGAAVFGFVSYGFNGYVNLQSAPDANGRDFTEYYLDQMKAAETANGGVRVVDALDLHYYPEATGDGQRITLNQTATQSAGLVGARLQAPRSLWDASYVETSWITSYLNNKGLALIPRMTAKIAQHYPGTRLAFSEYDFGGGDHVSGGIAQADALGIFGRDGVFAAMHWPLDANHLSFTYGGFAMFRNYDGKSSAFGDVSVSAQTSDAARTSVYASTDAKVPGRMVLVALNKTSGPLKASVKITFGSKLTRASAYELTGASSTPRAVATPPTPTCQAFVVTLPAMSVTTIALD